MKTYTRRSIITGAFLLLIYITIYMMPSWRTEISSPEVVADQEVMRRQMDRIEHALSKLGEFHFNFSNNTFKRFLLCIQNYTCWLYV